MEANKINAQHTMDNVVSLIIARLLLADKVAAAKWKTNKPIEDPVREKIILDTLLSKGLQLGIDLNWVEQFFSDQFTASKMIQYELFQKWNRNEDLPTEEISLQDDIRPAINELDNKLFQWASENLQSCRNLGLDVTKLIESSNSDYNLDEIHAKAFVKAISHLCVEKTTSTTL